MLLQKFHLRKADLEPACQQSLDNFHFESYLFRVFLVLKKNRLVVFGKSNINILSVKSSFCSGRIKKFIASFIEFNAQNPNKYIIIALIYRMSVGVHKEKNLLNCTSWSSNHDGTQAEVCHGWISQTSPPWKDCTLSSLQSRPWGGGKLWQRTPMSLVWAYFSWRQSNYVENI